MFGFSHTIYFYDGRQIIAKTKGLVIPSKGDEIDVGGQSYEVVGKRYSIPRKSYAPLVFPLRGQLEVFIYVRKLK